MIKFFPVPSGSLSEQGSERKNAVFRHDRQHHARQIGPLENMQDCALRSHRRSHPDVQAVMTKKQRHTHGSFDPEVVALFATPVAVLNPSEAVDTTEVVLETLEAAGEGLGSPNEE